ncbi:MAG: 4'-phosphopantetheinyl transferase superfamily protein [Ruminococcaceae bacterium]|nr:4'-phosphopantetheinyl transferase superfamily protein [Oscillospiraceae bacterium]
MKLKWTKLIDKSGHEAGRELLAALYREETRQSLPPIAHTPLGKPYFPGESWHFSISHTPRHAFCCLSRHPVGVDAEETDRAVDLRLIERYLSTSEQRRLALAQDKNAAFLRLWVLKEALAKATGRGIGNWLKETDFDPDDPRVTCIDGCYVAILEGEHYGF